LRVVVLAGRGTVAVVVVVALSTSLLPTEQLLMELIVSLLVQVVLQQIII
jgi:hypothetical protein